ncbi:glycosyltransferase family 4 protein [Paracoccus benzoatiresistens]|uniref:Glycosyltransferase family 4 protein n=1 Tax=Paracoccus benzoatiresistens TaxID=2997341 RepID=A0ABT4J5Q5_9RHOB|nr:glycosyltransferase family 4 protein [Paracoccus sp. EF6]MCZ0962413.1 glycosyltransferase family 4 protein [Paracoccus sp. EF6]
MMRVLMTSDAVGGVWHYSLELAAALQAEVVLAVLGPAPDADQRAAAQAAGLRLVETDLPLDWLSDGPGPVLAAGEAIARLARDLGADLVHLNAPALAVARFDRPVVAVNHGCLGTWWDAARGGAVNPTLAWLPDLVGQGLRAADLVVAPTRAYAEATARRYGLPVMPLPVHNGRTPMPLPDARPFPGALTVGRLWDEAKDTATLDAAAARLDAPFVAIGSTRAPHGATVTPAHLQATGPLPAEIIAHWLARRPVFASAARFEPFGLAVLEAAQAGCPLVLSDIPTFRELWDGAARFVEPGDAQGFADTIAATLTDPARHAAQGEAARSRAAHYTPAATAARMAEIYRDALLRRIQAA